MRENVGRADSYIRFLLGLAFFLNIFVIKPGSVGTIILLALSCVFFYTAHAHFCGLYIPFKINTATSPKEES